MKTRIELLEKMLNDVQEQLIYKEAELELCQGKIIEITGKVEYEKQRAFLLDTERKIKAEIAGTEKMIKKLEQFYGAEQRKKEK